MGVDALITLAVLVVAVAALVRERLSPPAVLLGAVVLLTILGVVAPAAAFAGFSDPATLTVAGLFVLARAIGDHISLAALLERVMGGSDGERSMLLRLCAPVAGVSAVVANTPIVASLAPGLRDWAERRGRAASHYLMPLSFAAILGGLVTTIGTSTTLVVVGLVRQLGYGDIGLFDITPVGVPVAVAGCLLLAVLAPRLLPDRSSPYASVASHERDYALQLRVVRGGALDARKVEDAGLRHLRSVFLARIDRGGRDIAPVRPDFFLHGGDTLSFVGHVTDVRDLLGVEGLEPVETQQTMLEGDRHGLFECIVSANSPLAGRTPKEVSFRGRYGGAVIAIHRQGARVDAKLGGVHLQAGDALLVTADPGFADRWRDRHDFAVVVALDDEQRAVGRRGWFVVLTMVAVVIAAAMGAGLLRSVLAGCALLVATRTISFTRARDALDLDVLLIIAAAIGIGGAVQSSGIASAAAGWIEVVAVGTGAFVALALILVATLVLTEMITNVAAAALMVPIALDVADRIGAEPHSFAIAVAVAASASFLTPIGYQTNTIVYGLGGYRFTDYWRLGLPLTVVVVAVALAVIPLL